MRPPGAVRSVELELARNGSLGAVFDHVAIAVTDLAASERFYRTLSVLGVEPSHADAELAEWEDWDIGPTDRGHPVTRGLHVGFRAPTSRRPSAPTRRSRRTPGSTGATTSRGACSSPARTTASR
jgi:catechol 2,3-dioxygenase-like lactoylglutathione lyase family enzyme